MALYLCASTEAYQLLKLPALISHYVQHCNEESGTTLLSFFKEHYNGEMVLDDDWQQDMELPFKTCSCSPVTICPTIAPDLVKLIIPEPIEIDINFTPFISTIPSNLRVIKIFQPPRPVFPV
ncbi:MAG: hypothetical protein MUE71_02365 [Chitinophagaceae bacterium]|nr:hypothetical protein [Chitinophagaceae bacterium]